MTIKRLTMRFGKRVMTSAVLISFLALGLFNLSTFWFTVGVSFFAAAALLEFFILIQRAGVPAHGRFGVVLGVLVPFAVYADAGIPQGTDVFVLVLGCLFIFPLQFLRRDQSRAIDAVSSTIFGVVYISWFLSFLIPLRFFQGGILWIIYLLCVTKVSDIASFVFGSVFPGRLKMFPHISPKKKLEGALAGVIISAVVSVGLGPFLPVSLSAVELLAVGFVLGALSKIGDLAASFIKRYAGVVDSGVLLPGIGGVLDVVDSMLFTTPIFYFYLKAIL